MKHATELETCTKIYFLFIFNLVLIRIRKTSILTVPFDDVTVKTIYTSLTIFKLFVGKFIVDLGKTRRNGKRGFGKVCTYFKKLIVLNLCEHQP